MPIQRCTLPNGGSGYKWGESGKCYSDREDALRQMRAIKVNQANKTEADLKELEEIDLELRSLEIEKYIHGDLKNNGYNLDQV